MDREIYWSVSRWYGRAKTSFFVGLCLDILYFLALSAFTAILVLDSYNRKEIGHILLCVISWVILVLLVLHIVFQGHMVANKMERIKRKLKGAVPAYTEIEFFSDHFIFKSGIYDEIAEIPYTNIVGYKETTHYCVLITVSGAIYAYGKKEFVQGSAAEAYALFSKGGNW